MDEGKAICMLLESETSSSNTNSTVSSDNLSEWSSQVSSISSNDYWIHNNDNVDVLLFPLLKYLTTGNKRNRVEDYLSIVESWSDVEFKENLRVPRRIAYKLIDDLETSDFIPKNSFGKPPITGKISFLIFLWFISNTEPLRTISDPFDISISSVFRVLRRVLAWILTKMNESIKWPHNNNEILTVCDGFYNKKQIPSVLGAIDCSHIRIEKPSVNQNDYCNRKKYFSINLQAVIDSRCRFTNVYCGEPGSLHDARVLRRSPLYDAAIQNKEDLFPRNTFLIGDSAYPSLSWLVPPFRDNGRLTPEQTQFNFIHSSTRMAVKKAFGLLKGRFRRIKFFSEYRELSFVTNTVIAACILHNYCINECDDFQTDDSDDGFETENCPVQENFENHNLLDRRMMLFREMFPFVI